ncbi:WXG100 family type VII secretion target [Streptomyces sp. NPDC090075]|uniref:WXG100 family type VII secretion target n=1 Tax=unclassified Streptomyces TaxID=2593676 RepID=UPI003717D41A
MADYIVNDEKTSAASANTMNEYQTAVAQLQKIAADLQALTEDGYNTPAAKKYFLPFVDEFRQHYLQVIDGLTGISKFLDGVGQGFNQLDEDMGSSLNK